MGEAGFTVDRADNGRDGLFLASDGSYGAIILDRMMPAMDGMAMLKALRAAEIETPVIILSALGKPEDRVEGLTSGPEDRKRVVSGKRGAVRVVGGGRRYQKKKTKKK